MVNALAILQCPGDTGIDVEVVGGCLCAKGKCDGKFPNGVHGGSINGARGDSPWFTGCSWSCCKRAVPTTQMSAGEGGGSRRPRQALAKWHMT